MAIRNIKRGVGERTSIKELRCNTVPQVGLVNSFQGDVVDIHTKTDGTVLKIKTTIGITPTWLSNIVGGEAATRGSSSKGAGIGSLRPISFSPFFRFLGKLPYSDYFYLQATHYDAWSSIISSGIIKGGLKNPLGSYPLVSARSNSYSLNGLIPPLGQYGEIRKEGIVTQQIMKRSDLKFSTLISFKNMKGLFFRSNINSSNPLSSNIYGYIIENADYYIQLRYSLVNTNILHNAKRIIQNRLYSKIKIDSFERPITN